MVRIFGFFGLAMILSACGGSDEPLDLTVWKKMDVIHFQDACGNPSTHTGYLNNVTIQQSGKQVRIEGNLKVSFVEFDAFTGTLEGDNLKISATAASDIGGCQISASFLGEATVHSTDIFGSLESTWTQSPAGCAPADFCPAVDYFFQFYK